MSRSRGFTLLEALLSVALIALIAGVTAPIFSSFATRSDLDIAATTLAQNLRRAPVLARAVDGDSAWGVKIATGTITIFKGPTYAGRDSTYDESYAIASSIILSGTTEYDFVKFTGLPSSTGTTTLTSVSGEVRTVSINAKGTVSY